MAVKVGKCVGKNGPRSRPLGVMAAAKWSDERQCWEDGDYWFDERTASAAANFFPEHLRFTKGKWKGKPFVLEEWQETIVRQLFGWKRADGTRRYRRCYVWIPRKNGKTELAAGIALLLLIADGEPAAEVYAIAANDDQARIVFNQAISMIGQSKSLSEELTCLKSSIYDPGENGSFKPLSGKAEGKHGFNTSGMIGDEIHEWKDGDLYQFIHDSEDARSQPLEFMISTTGKRGTYAEDVWNECQNILDGTFDDPETMVVIFAANDDDDWTKEATWRKANPNLGVSKSLDAMRANAKRAMQMPRLENAFKCYHLNMWSEQAVRWLPIDGMDDEGKRFGWDYCKGPVEWQNLESWLSGKKCFGGLDLSSTTDLSAIVYFFPVQPDLDVPFVLPRFFKPEAYIKQHGKRDKLDYEGWVRSGALSATPGNVIDYAFIKEQIHKDAHNFDVENIGIDPWNATQVAIELQQEGIGVEFMRQGFASLTTPSKELERLVLSNGFAHGGHPILRRHAQVVAVEQDPADNIKPAKNKSTERIDGIAGLVNAIGVALTDEGEDDGSYLEEMEMVVL